MTIGEVEQRTGLERATVRFYEREGLLTPARLANGYREYGESDVATLLRIKLLRELDVSLEDLRALERGEQKLSDTLERRLRVMEQEVEKAAHARQTCRAIRDEGVCWDELDAEKYLHQVEMSGGHCAADRDTPPRAFCPWRRYFARTLDLAIYRLIWNEILALVFHVNLMERFWLLQVMDVVVSMLLMLVVEPLLLSRWGTTPGKALFGLRLERADGGRLRYDEAFRRTGAVLWRGLGWELPIYSLYRLYKSYTAYEVGELSWDTELDVVWEARPGSWLRGLGFVAASVACAGLATGLALSAGFPPNRDGLTVAEFAENYNFLMDFYRQEPAYVLDVDGAWVEREPANVTISLDGMTNEPPAPLLYETDAEGRLTAVTLTRSYDDVQFAAIWPGYEMQMLALAFAAGEGSWFRCWGNLELLDVIAEVGGFRSFSRNRHGVALRAEVELEGFSGGGSFLIPEEGTQCSGSLVYSVRAA